MDHLSDTNVLLRSIQPAHAMQGEALRAIETLLSRGDRVCIAPQNIIEFWNACTRPTKNNGLGLSLQETDRQVARLESLLVVLPEVPEVYLEWRRLVVQHGVSGVKVYDARLVAVMRAYSIEGILTFNVQDFLRYPNIRAVSPREIDVGKFPS